MKKGIKYLQLLKRINFIVHHVIILFGSIYLAKKSVDLIKIFKSVDLIKIFKSVDLIKIFKYAIFLNLNLCI
jgi:hypothetical protein